MAELKTRPMAASAARFVAAIADETRRAECRTLMKLMRKATGSPAKMWGGSIVGFGRYHYVYDSGREGDWFLAGFSPRKQTLTIYVMGGLRGHDALVKRLGPVKVSQGSCIYVKRLADVDLAALEKLLAASVRTLRARRK
jgi:hypothetical protein